MRVVDEQRRPLSFPPHTCAFLLYAAFYLAACWQFVTADRYFARGDAFDLTLPTFLAPLRLWEPGMFSGFPAPADPQSMTWNPLLRGAAAISHAPLSWNLFVLAPFVIGSCSQFSYVFALTRCFPAALVAGLVLTLSGSWIAHTCHVNLLHALAWAPLILAGFERLGSVTDRRSTAGPLATAALGVAGTMLGGHSQVAAYAIYLSLAYVAFRARSARRRLLFLGSAALALAIGASLAAIQTLPSLELLRLSARWPGEMSRDQVLSLFQSYAMPPAQLLNWFYGGLFGGVKNWNAQAVPYFGGKNDVELAAHVGALSLLVLPFLFLDRRRLGAATFWLVVAVVGVLLSLGPATPIAAAAAYLPLLAGTRAVARFGLLTTIALSSLAGIALAKLFAPHPSRRCVLCCLAASFAILAAFSSLATALRGQIEPRFAEVVRGGLPFGPFWTLELLRPAFCLAALAVGSVALLARPSRKLGGALIFLAFLGERTGFVVRGWPILEAERPLSSLLEDPRVEEIVQIARASGQRVLAVDGYHNPLVTPNLTRIWNVPNASGVSSLIILRYARLLSMDAPGDVKPATLRPADRSLDLLGVRFAFARDGSEHAQVMASSPDRWRAVAALEGYSVFENLRAMPRVRFARQLVPTSDDDVLSRLKSSGIGTDGRGQPADVALLSEGVIGALPAERPERLSFSGDATILESDWSEPGRLRLRVRSPGQALVVASEVAYPGWRAEVDGRAAPILRVDYLLQGVVVPPGESEVLLRFRPRTLFPGAAASALGLVALVGICVAAYARGARREAGSRGFAASSGHTGNGPPSPARDELC